MKDIKLLKYTAKIRDCPVCRGKDTLLIYPDTPFQWAYCTRCRHSTGAAHALGGSTTGTKTRRALWYIAESTVKNFVACRGIPPVCRKRFHMATQPNDPVRMRLFNHFVGFGTYSSLRYLLSEFNFLCHTAEPKPGRKREDLPVIILPTQFVPGWVNGFAFLYEDKTCLLRIKENFEHLPRHIWLRVSTNPFREDFIENFDICLSAAREAALFSGDLTFACDAETLRLPFA